jgi:hypothetical protein
MRQRFRSSIAVLAVLAIGILAAPAVAEPGDPSPEPTSPFTDIAGSVHATAILTLAQTGVTRGCAADRFCPEQAVTRAQMATLLASAISLPPAVPSFSDVSPDSVHAPNIGALESAGITTGCGDGRYCPLLPLTRAQVATMLARTFGLEPDPEIGFSDVPQDSVHAPGISALASTGIVTGYGDGTFRPNLALTRAQLATMLFRAIGLDGPLPCPALPPDEPARPIGPSVPGHAYTSAVRAGGSVHVFSNDLLPHHAARFGQGQAAGSVVLPTGRRTWASTVVGDMVYVGVWGTWTGQANVLGYPADAPDGASAQPIAELPTSGEFWTLTSDDDGRLYAGTRAHLSASFRAQIGLGPDQHVVHRVDPDAPAGQRVEHLRFTVPDLPVNDNGFRPDVKQLAWIDGTLYVGLGNLDRGARLYAVDTAGFDEPDPDPAPDAGDGSDDITDPELPIATDLTPATITDARAVFSLAVDETTIVLGTQAAGSGQARWIVLDRQDPTQTLVDRLLEDEARVDAVALGEGRAVGVAFPSGTLWAADVSDRTAPVSSVALADPIAGTATRYVEVRDGRVLGVSAHGDVWQTVPFGPTTVTRADTWLGPPVGSGLPHSMTARGDMVAVGSNGSVHLRPIDGSPVVATDVPGEAKRLAITDDGVVWAAMYPAGQLWRVGRDGSSRLHTDWDTTWGRPSGMVVDESRQVAHVLARTLDFPPSSAWIAIDLDPADPEATVLSIHPISDVLPGADPDAAVLADVVLPADDGGVIVADRTGIVRHLRPDGTIAWTAANWPGPLPDGPPIPIALDRVGDVLVATTTAGIVEFDPTSGEVIRAFPDIGPAPTGAWSAGQATMTTTLTTLRLFDRATGRVREHHQRPSDGTWLASPIAASDGCTIHLIGGRELYAVPLDARHRLPVWTSPAP